MKLYTTSILLSVAPIHGIYALEDNNRQTKENNHPNVIIVITDDQGKGDLGCLGNDIIKTPHIDEFYNNAIRLHNFHVSPTSAPTRAALMTGRFTDRTNTFHTVGGRDKIYEDERLMPQIFAENGYKTAMFGKWHLGDNYPFRPEDRGFQEVVRHGGGGIGQAPDYWGNDYFDDTYWHNSVPQPYKGYCTDVFFNEAIKYIEQNKNSPFFCYISTNAPHSPYNVPKKYYDRYKDTKLPEQIKRFYGMISNIDDNFKRLEDKLEELGIADNTILIFMTDNGTAGGYAANNGGMRGMKNSEYEGGHCVPFFLRWKQGNLQGGTDINQLCAHVDLLPTFVDLCKLKFTPIKPIDGKSIKPLLYDQICNWKERCLITDSQRLQNLVKWRKSAVMTEQWRLINGKELYNIPSDKMQKNNIAEQHPDIVKFLRSEYEAWWQSIDKEESNSRYAYTWAGSPYENPVRLSVHELHTANMKHAWEQKGALEAETMKGVYKIKFISEGRYKITLCRYPLESGYKINQEIPKIKQSFEVEKPLPASNGIKMVEAQLYVADLTGKESIKPVSDNDYGVSFETYIYEGKYDLEAFFTDESGRFYTAYYHYIEKLP